MTWVPRCCPAAGSGMVHLRMAAWLSTKIQMVFVPMLFESAVHILLPAECRRGRCRIPLHAFLGSTLLQNGGNSRELLPS